jgi:D-alanine-D-alanine ligase-like ATP-grasp enzyme
MRKVLFVAPFAVDTTLRFIDGAAEVAGSRLFLISQDPIERFPVGLRAKIAGHWKVDNALDSRVLIEATKEVQRRVGRIHRLLGTLEQLQVPLAEVREALGIPGMGVEAAINFREKAQMKDVLRKARIPCARHKLIAQADDAWSFVDQVGYPIVVKPPAGAGAKGTYQIENAEQMRELLDESPPHPQRPLLAEEFIRGSEHSFDAVSIDGKMVWQSLTHYLPTPLDAVRNPWIQWCVLLPREIDHPKYDDIRQAAGAALDALGMDTGTSHMEWFRRADGSIAISEVGARPGGAQISKLMSYAHEFSFYKAWGRLMIDEVWHPPSREWAAGAAFLRAQGEGRRIQTIRGLGQANQEIGHLVVESNLPKIGQSPSTSYEGEGFVILRHRETEVVHWALQRLISLIRVELG